VTSALVEVPPDTQSNMLGFLLFLPLLTLLYAAIVTVSAQKGVMPSILESIQGMIWYIMGGAIVVAIGVAGASFVVGAVIRTISQPTSTSRIACATVPSTSSVSVVVMDWTAMGRSPPISRSRPLWPGVGRARRSGAMWSRSGPTC